jgi:DNA-binding GntR family transcriptional regulator
MKSKPSLQKRIQRDSQTGPLSGAVYSALLSELNAGRLRPGEQLREVELAKRLGVSRTPVREALQRLMNEEVLIKNNGGLSVPLIEDKQIFELYEMREALEGTAAALAARHASPPEAELLERIIQEEIATNDADAARHAQLNRDFHAVIYRAAANRYLLRSLHTLQDTIMRLRSTTFSISGRPRQAIREHQAIQSGIAKRDPDAAEAAARLHIREALRSRMLLTHAAGTGSAYEMSDGV